MSDERTRKLERRAAAGDAEAALKLARQRCRQKECCGHRLPLTDKERATLENVAHDLRAQGALGIRRSADAACRLTDMLSPDRAELLRVHIERGESELFCDAEHRGSEAMAVLSPTGPWDHPGPLVAVEATCVDCLRGWIKAWAGILTVPNPELVADRPRKEPLYPLLDGGDPHDHDGPEAV